MCPDLKRHVLLSSLCLYEEDNETEEDVETALPGRILNWLVRTKWLRKIEDYEAMTTNIVIPDYAAVMIRHLKNWQRSR